MGVWEYGSEFDSYSHKNLLAYSHILILSYMNLEILTPEKKLFSDEVYGVQLPGVNGSFELLNKHAPLISALKTGRIKVLNDKTHTTFFEIRSGFVEVLNNRVTVLVEGAMAV
jgi:F-type H+-transporting ATPase subunit epsilon